MKECNPLAEEGTRSACNPAPRGLVKSTRFAQVSRPNLRAKAAVPRGGSAPSTPEMARASTQTVAEGRSCSEDLRLQEVPRLLRPAKGVTR